MVTSLTTVISCCQASAFVLFGLSKMFLLWGEKKCTG